MKKLLIAIGVAIAFAFSASASTAKEKIDARVINSFKGKFIGAKDEAWAERTDFYEVSFILQEKKYFAFYAKTRG